MGAIIGLDERTVTVMQSVLQLATRDLNRRSDIAEARARICEAVTIVLRSPDLPEAILTDSGLWFPPDLTDDEKVAFACDIYPRLKRQLSTRVWKQLDVRS